MDFYEFFAPRVYGKGYLSFTYEEQAIMDLFPGKSNEEMVEVLKDSIEIAESVWERHILEGLLEKLQPSVAPVDLICPRETQSPEDGECRSYFPLD